MIVDQTVYTIIRTEALFCGRKACPNRRYHGRRDDVMVLTVEDPLERCKNRLTIGSDYAHGNYGIHDGDPLKEA